jgi:uridine kinase
VLRRELRHVFDITVYVRTTPATRRARLHARGENDPQWIRRWMAAEQWYERHHQPRQCAHFVIRGG